MKIGEIVKQQRLSKNLTLRDVERGTNISNAYLSQLENGKITSPGIKVLTDICSFLDLPFEKLVNGAKDEQQTFWNEINVFAVMLTESEKNKLIDYAKFLMFTRSHSDSRTNS